MSSIKRAVFPVAGLGTRFLPATKSIPKEILTLVDRPLIQYAIDEAREAGIEEFIFVTSRGKSSLEDYFDFTPNLYNSLKEKGKEKEMQIVMDTTMESGQISYVRQNIPLGLGHAVWCARHILKDEPFAVILPDDVIHGKTGCLKQMIEAYEFYGGSFIAAENVPLQEVHKYGVFNRKQINNSKVHAVKNMVEKPPGDEAPSTLVAIGRYILHPSVLKNLEGLEPGAGNEIQLTDAINKSTIHDVFAFEFEGERFDCGSKIGYLKATIKLGLDREEFSNDLRLYIDTLD